MGRPTDATLCFDSTKGSARILDPATTYAGLRAAAKGTYTPEMCATDEMSGSLVLAYAGGKQAQLQIEGVCPAVVEPGRKSLYIPPQYAGPFDPYN
jgi:hypothetical protein